MRVLAITVIALNVFGILQLTSSETGDACTSLRRTNGVSFGSHCYLFDVTNELAYPEATAACMKLGARLVTVRDKATENFLLQQMGVNQWTRMWTGLTKTKNAHWAYTYGDTLLYGQGCFQDNATSRDLSTQIYAGGVPSYFPSMTSDTCYEPCKGGKHRFMGIQLLSTGFRPGSNNGKRDTGCFCGDSYGKYGETTGCTESCYVSSGQGTALCGGVLKNYVYSLQNEGNSAWAAGYPRGQGSCARLSGSGAMFDDSCGKQYRYMCIVNTDVTSWYISREKCAALGTGWDLLYMTSLTKSPLTGLAFSSTKDSTLPDSKKSFWVGAYKSSWEWYDGNKTDYYNWMNGQPDSESNKCMKLQKSTPEGARTWQSASCDSGSQHRDHFACQVDPTLEFTPTTTTTTAAPSTTTRELTQPPATSTTTELVITGAPPPDTGASEQTQGLTIFQKLLIFCAVLSVAAGIVSLSLFIYYKKAHKVASVSPSKYEAMPDANGMNGYGNGHQAAPVMNGYGNGHQAAPEIFTNTSGSTWQPEKIMID